MINTTNQKLLEVSNLSVDFICSSGVISAVDNISFELERGEIVAIVGESGCGKSVTCLSLAGLVDDTVSKTSGSIYLCNNAKKLNILNLNKKDLRSLRGGQIAYIFQDPSSSLNPVFKIKDQLYETILEHDPVDNPESRAEELLEMVGISDPKYRLNSYPCQLSGGMQQRVMIAMALAGNPQLLIADEPTTALDVTIQAQILALLKEISKKTNMSIIIVTHNLGIVVQLAQRVMIMYGGHIVESALTSELFSNPLHPYTKALLNSTPSLGKGKVRLQTIQGSVATFNKDYKGCRFAQRCPLKEELKIDTSKCLLIPPPLIEVGLEHSCFCHFVK